MRARPVCLTSLNPQDWLDRQMGSKPREVKRQVQQDTAAVETVQ
jgi:hypothetical protein